LADVVGFDEWFHLLPKTAPPRLGNVCRRPLPPIEEARKISVRSTLVGKPDKQWECGWKYDPISVTEFSLARAATAGPQS
jgi:hypothetical protein